MPFKPLPRAAEGPAAAMLLSSDHLSHGLVTGGLLLLLPSGLTRVCKVTMQGGAV